MLEHHQRRMALIRLDPRTGGLSAAQMPEAPPPTERAQLDEAADALREGAARFASLSIEDRIALLHAMRAGYARVANRVVLASCRAKRIVPGTPQEAEEWALGPWPVLRHFRLLLESLASLARGELPQVGHTDRTSDGAIRIQLFPGDAIDRAAVPQTRVQVQLRPGLDGSSLDTRARIYRGVPIAPRVGLVLGAGNASGVPCMDLLTRMFNYGMPCLLKLHPLNAYLGPLYREAFSAAIERGFLRIVYGGAETGEYLAQLSAVDEIHLTGSAQTYNRLVLAAPGKRISSQLGCVSPILIVPHALAMEDLGRLAAYIAGAVAHNAACNCTTPRLIVTPYTWELREAFVGELETALSNVPLRMAYYPGAVERWQYLTNRKTDVLTVGSAVGGVLPWTIVPDLDPADENEPLFSLEAFCPVLGEVQIGSGDSFEYLEDAVAFVNERVAGSLSATIFAHPRSLKDPGIAGAIERAVQGLRSGTVGVNSWPQLSFSLAGPPWGAHHDPLDESQSRSGWVHNTAMLEGIDKCVVREIASARRKPMFAAGHPSALHLFNRLASLELKRSWRAVPGVVGATFLDRSPG
jgi:acyl-CoA reductase-like NAD-dependent aldehyde dehydrogenase